MKGNLSLQVMAVVRLYALALIGFTVLIPIQVSANQESNKSLNSSQHSSQHSSQLSPEALLTNMSEALRKTNFEGRFMYVVGNETSSFEVQHAVINGKEYERLVFLNQKDQEVVRVGHDLFCVHPGNHLLRQHQEISTNPFADKLANLGKGLYDNYKLSVEEHQMVAGRETFKVTFKSKDNNRYDHHLWIDEKSKLLLKADISDPMLGTLESFEYVQITIGDNIPKTVFEHKNFVRHSPKHFVPSQSHVESDVISSAVGAQESEKWQATWLPQGFYFSGESLQALKASKVDEPSKVTVDSQRKANIKMLMYTDGIAAITIFVEPVKTDSQFNESSQMGALSAYSHSVKLDEQYFMITAVGEVQLQTVERVAKGLRFR